jgi:hypothetical protein
MSFVRVMRKSSSGFLSYRAAIICVAALGIFWGRVAPPAFSQASVNVSTHADHDRQHCFSHEDSQWVVTPSATPNARPPFVSSRLVRPSQSLVELVTDGWHYNRPPPIG